MKRLSKLAFMCLAVISLGLKAQDKSLSALSALSALPVLSVMSVGVGASMVTKDLAQVPIALSTGGAKLLVKGVEASGKGTVVLLERVSDGVQASVLVAGHSALAVGKIVETTVLASGVLLSAAGQAIAFLPNELGRALLHNEKISK